MLKLFYMSVSDAPYEIPTDISEYRKNKIISARSEKAKRVLTAAALVLKAGFDSFGVSEKDVAYMTLENGKPYALSHPEIHFSLSHSETMAVAAFSDSPVGIDCERVNREIPPLLLKRFFPREAEDYKDEPLLLWVAGESLTKLSGEGIFGAKSRTSIPVFEENKAKFDKITLEKIIIEDNLTVVSTEKYEKAEIMKVC